MPLIDEIKNSLLLIARMPEEEQRDIAESLSIRVVAFNYASWMTPELITELTIRAFENLSRTLNQLRQPSVPRQPSKPGGRQR
jgi:hypothetical protein